MSAKTHIILTEGFHGFCQFSQGNAGIVSHISLLLHSCVSFAIRYFCPPFH